MSGVDKHLAEVKKCADCIQSLQQAETDQKGSNIPSLLWLARRFTKHEFL